MKQYYRKQHANMLHRSVSINFSSLVYVAPCKSRTFNCKAAEFEVRIRNTDNPGLQITAGIGLGHK